MNKGKEKINLHIKITNMAKKRMKANKPKGQNMETIDFIKEKMKVEKNLRETQRK